MKWPLVKALLVIVVSTLLITGSAHLGLCYYKHVQIEKIETNNYRITEIYAPNKSLPIEYLAELMHLSYDKPTRIARFNIEKAEMRLEESPLIKSATVSLKKPGIAAVDYTSREPLLSLLDFENIAVDEEGAVFPLTPYLSPKRLPYLYLGISRLPAWHTPIDHPSLDLALSLYSLCLEYHLLVERIDVSLANAQSLGQREVVLLVDSHIVRLTPKGWVQELANYMELRSSLLEVEPQIVDLRIPNLCFVGAQSTSS